MEKTHGEFHTVWVRREDLQKVLDAYPYDSVCYFGLDIVRGDEDKILWVMKSDGTEPAIIINKPQD